MGKFKEERENKKNVIALVVLCISIVMLTTSLTYAYFTSQMGVNEQEKVTITSGTLALTFRDNDDTVENIERTLNFGDTVEKELIIENTGTIDTYAKISWENLINTYLAQSLTYKLEVKESGETEYSEVGTVNKNIPRSDVPATVPLAEGLLIRAGKTNRYRLTIVLEDLEDTDQTQDINARFATKFTIEESTKPVKVLLINELLRKANPVEITEYTSGEKGEMYSFEHNDLTIDQVEGSGEGEYIENVGDVAVQIKDWTEEERRDYRYIGNVPNNYIIFNDEMWRIIGVFTVENEVGIKEQRVKIMREESIGKMIWDNKTPAWTDFYDWKESQLQNILNEDYYNKKDAYSNIGLIEKAHKMISQVKFYTEGPTAGGRWSIANIYPKDLYNIERSKNDKSVFQNVGLLFASDIAFTYVDNVNSWVISDSPQWSMTPFRHSFQESAEKVSGAYGVGNIMFLYYLTDKLEVRPVVYLNSDIIFIEGDGSQDNPYIIE